MNGESSNGVGSLELIFLGQMGFRIQYGETILYIDPFLSSHPKRKVSSPMAVSDVNDACLILGTHDHKDHIDRDAWPTYAALSPNALFVVPELLLRKKLAEDLKISSERFVGLTHGSEFSFRDIQITAVHSAHEFLDKEDSTGLYPYLGYIIEVGGYVLYHAGDTCRFEGIEALLRDRHLDVMVLPINGRDAKRYSEGCIGNMTYQEAADLAGSLQPGLVIPGHFDMFEHNGEDPLKFDTYMKVKYPEQAVRILTCGESCLLAGK